MNEKDFTHVVSFPQIENQATGGTVAPDTHTPNDWLPSEALYAFAGWLTSRRERTVMSATDWVAPAADAVAEFCKRHSLAEPREGWHRIIIAPKAVSNAPPADEDREPSDASRADLPRGNEAYAHEREQQDRIQRDLK